MSRTKWRLSGICIPTDINFLSHLPKTGRCATENQEIQSKQKVKR